MKRSPSSLMSSFTLPSIEDTSMLEYMRSALHRSFLTASTRAPSARPADSWIGRMWSVTMGRAEFGVKCGSQVPTGRSYHGVEVSP